MISDFGAGGILLGMSAMLMIPTTLGLADYGNNGSDQKTTQTKFYQIIQTIMLALAIIGFFLGALLMVKGTRRTGATISTGGGSRSRRNVSDFELF